MGHEIWIGDWCGYRAEVPNKEDDTFDPPRRFHLKSFIHLLNQLLFPNPIMNITAPSKVMKYDIEEHVEVETDDPDGKSQGVKH